MHTTIELLDLLKTRHGWDSDYRVAKEIGVTKQAVSYWRNGMGSFGNSESIRIARLLNFDPAYVMACANHDRAKSDDERQVWERIARAVAAGVCGVALIGGSLVASPAAQALDGLHLMVNRQRRRAVGETTDLPLAA